MGVMLTVLGWWFGVSIVAAAVFARLLHGGHGHRFKH
jgi:hypothetical protein